MRGHESSHLLVLARCAPETQEGAGLVFFNASVMTRDPERPEGTAFTIQGDRIVAVGDDGPRRRHPHRRRIRPPRGSGGAALRNPRCRHPAGSARPAARRLASRRTSHSRRSLRAYTGDAAFEAFEDDRKGRIAPGFWADLTILHKDLREIAPEEIPSVRVTRTIVGGQIVFESPK